MRFEAVGAADVPDLRAVRGVRRMGAEDGRDYWTIRYADSQVQGADSMTRGEWSDMDKLRFGLTERGRVIHRVESASIYGDVAFSWCGRILELTFEKLRYEPISSIEFCKRCKTDYLDSKHKRKDRR